MTYVLKPIPRVWLRVSLLAVVSAIGWMSGIAWWGKLFGLVFWTFVFGTFPVAGIREGRFRKRYVIAFVSLRTRSWLLERCTRIEVNLAQQTSFWSFILFGFVNYVFFLVFDWLFPWFGGNCRIYLRRAKGGRILVWQGNSDTEFQSNLRHLERVTGLPVGRTGDTR